MILSFSVQIYLQKSAKCLTHFAPLPKQPERFPAKRRLHLRRGKTTLQSFVMARSFCLRVFACPFGGDKQPFSPEPIIRYDSVVSIGRITQFVGCVKRIIVFFAQICNPLPQNLLNCVIDFYWKSVILKPYKQHKQRSICHVRKLSGYHRLCCRF